MDYILRIIIIGMTILIQDIQELDFIQHMYITIIMTEIQNTELEHV